MNAQEFISTLGPLANKDMQQNGILASVTIAQGCLESGYASTDLAVNANNLFGMKCSLSGNTWPNSAWDGSAKYTKVTQEQKPDGTIYDVTADFRKYPNWQSSVNDHSAYLAGAKRGSELRYKGLVGERDYKKAIQIIKDGGYATDINYVSKICNIIERYNLTQYDVLPTSTDKKLLIVLDPGHCPKYNPGVVAGYFEGDKMYDFTLYEKAALESYGIPVIITRDRESDLELYERAYVAVNNGKGYKDVLFISNHSNGGGGVGVEVYRSLYLPQNAELGKKLVDIVVDIMRPITGVTVSRGVKTLQGKNGDYHGVIRNSVQGAKSEAEAAKGPVTYSFIVEHGFHDNVKECTFLNSLNNLKKMAEAEAKVIAEYFGYIENSSTSKVEEKVEELYRVRKSWEDAKSQLNAFTILDNAKREADAHPGYYVFNSKGECIYPEPKESTPFLFKVTDNINIYTGPGTNNNIARVCPIGTYTIVETKVIDNCTWGRLKSGAGWILIENNQPFVPYSVRVKVEDLRIRKGPGNNYDFYTDGGKPRYTGKGVFTILEEADGPGAKKWGWLKYYKDHNIPGWIALDLCEKVK